MSNDDRLQLASLGLHPDRARDLVESWGTPGAVLRAIRLGQVTASAAIQQRLDIDPWAAAHQAGAVIDWQEDLPAELQSLPDCPDLLFRRGAELPVGPGVAIVGTRRATRYGLDVARRFGRAVAEAGWPVVSGLARGIDGAAHTGCLEAGGTAVAVLGCGVDRCYPPEHRPLAARILETGGSIVSEYGPGSPPEGWRFPPRNRIISGLSGAVVVIEAGVKGGALITAARGLDHARLVLAVPGDIDRATSYGCNLLIRDGAHPVLDTDDLITSLTFVLGLPPARARRLEDPIVVLLAEGPQSTEEITAALGCRADETLRRVAALELAGLVANNGGRVELVPRPE